MSDEQDPNLLSFEEICEFREWRLLSQLALRVAISIQGMPGRCRQKACHKSGRCHLILDLEGGGHCGAKFDIDQALHDASHMLAYLVQVWRVYAEQQPWSPYANDTRFGDPLKRKNRKRKT